jgi:hypothetical protein
MAVMDANDWIDVLVSSDDVMIRMVMYQIAIECSFIDTF